jgi:hypothetical protein
MNETRVRTIKQDDRARRIGPGEIGIDVLAAERDHVSESAYVPAMKKDAKR